MCETKKLFIKCVNDEKQQPERQNDLKNGIKQQTIVEKKKRLFWFLLTGPAGAAINDLLVYLTWDHVPGGDDLAALMLKEPPPLKAPLSSLSASLGVISSCFSLVK